MFGFSIKKLFRNKWMMICLLLGFVISIAVISSIPMYTNSILQRLLMKDLEELQIEDFEDYPGHISVSTVTITEDGEDGPNFEKYYELLDKIDNGLATLPQMELDYMTKLASYPNAYLEMVSTSSAQTSSKKNITLHAMQNINEHVELIAGETPSGERLSDGSYEVMVTEKMYSDFSLNIGNTYTIYQYEDDEESVKLKVVGVFTHSAPDDVYWYFTVDYYSKSFMMDYDLFNQDFVANNQVDGMYYLFSYDYHTLQMRDVNSLINSYNMVNRQVGDYGKMNFSALEVMEDYSARMDELNTTLWILLAPVIIMLLFYIFMISTLIMDYEKNDISLLKSRGANNLQVFIPIAIQVGIVCVVAIVLGLILGYALVAVLGLSNGFMEIIGRSALDIQVNIDSTLMISLAVIIGTGIISMLIPAFAACRLSIVEHKRNIANVNKTPFWKKFGLDFIMLAISGYAIYNYNVVSSIMLVSNTTMLAKVDPMLFVINTLLILSLGLLFLRIFPFILKFIFFLGKRFFSPEIYASLLSIARSGGKEQFIVLFLILTVSLAMFSATTARTLNTFMLDRVSYENGADMVMKPAFPSNVNYYIVDDSDGEGDVAPQLIPVSQTEAENNGNYITTVDYLDIPISPIQEVEGIESATKVYTNDDITITSTDANANAKMMAVTPSEFAEVVWSRSDLFPHHINEYLNLMAQDSRACLISSSVHARGFDVGDEINITWNDQPYEMTAIVYGIVDKWPTFNPVQNFTTGELTSSNFVITNYSLYNSQMKFEPFDIWASVDDVTPTAEIYEDLNENEINLMSFVDTNQEIIEIKNDPMLQGINGTLTLSFIVTLVVTLVGFIVFWTLNIKERTLQFGILRAMGLSKYNLITMLVFEQVILSGGAVIAGVIIGNVVNNITVPLLQNLYSPVERMPEFLVHMLPEDLIRIFVVIAVMMLIGVAVLGYIVTKIKIDQALKLGEE